MVVSRTGAIERTGGELMEGNAPLLLHFLQTGFMWFKNVVNFVQSVNFNSHNDLCHC
jgi:hypothetical protein